jgi:hypothetical protein
MRRPVDALEHGRFALQRRGESIEGAHAHRRALHDIRAQL